MLYSYVTEKVKMPEFEEKYPEKDETLCVNIHFD